MGLARVVFCILRLNTTTAIDCFLISFPALAPISFTINLLYVLIPSLLSLAKSERMKGFCEWSNPVSPGKQIPLFVLCSSHGTMHPGTVSSMSCSQDPIIISENNSQQQTPIRRPYYGLEDSHIGSDRKEGFGRMGNIGGENQSYFRIGNLGAIRRPNEGSRMGGDVHVRFWESAGVKSPRASQHTLALKIVTFSPGSLLSSYRTRSCR